MYIYIALAAMLTCVVLLMGIRLCRLRHYNVPVTDGRNTLLKYYLVFTIGYIMQVISDSFMMRTGISKFALSLLFNLTMLFNDAIPITCLLYFHFQNFKPHQHELIIRLDRDDSSSVNDEMLDSNELLLIQDGMFN